jgi:hypothetical protein
MSGTGAPESVGIEIFGIPLDWFIAIVVVSAIIVAIWAWWKLS